MSGRLLALPHHMVYVKAYGFNLGSLRDVDLEGFAHCPLNVAVFQASAPAQDEGAPFVGIFHKESPKRYGHYSRGWTNDVEMRKLCSCLGRLR